MEGFVLFAIVVLAVPFVLPIALWVALYRTRTRITLLEEALEEHKQTVERLSTIVAQQRAEGGPAARVPAAAPAADTVRQPQAPPVPASAPPAAPAPVPQIARDKVSIPPSRPTPVAPSQPSTAPPATEPAPPVVPPVPAAAPGVPPAPAAPPPVQPPQPQSVPPPQMPPSQTVPPRPAVPPVPAGERPAAADRPRPAQPAEPGATPPPEPRSAKGDTSASAATAAPTRGAIVRLGEPGRGEAVLGDCGHRARLRGGPVPQLFHSTGMAAAARSRADRHRGRRRAARGVRDEGGQELSVDRQRARWRGNRDPVRDILRRPRVVGPDSLAGHVRPARRRYRAGRPALDPA